MTKYILEHYEYIKGLHERIDELEEVLRSFSTLIDESQGVAGLHLNGEIAPWGELLGGGRYEEWLIDFTEAMSSISDPTPPAKEQAIVNEPFDGWQPEIVIIKRKDGKPINNWETNNE
jgi:hypothetical protein